MKKNYFLRASVLLLALCTLTAGMFVGTGTMAKYIAAGTGEAAARVAKFSVTITDKKTGTGEELATSDGTIVPLGGSGSVFSSLFSKTYAKTDTSYTTGTNTVDAADLVVAPGTSGGEADAFTVTNNSEVAVRVTAVITAVTNIGEGSGQVPLRVKTDAGWKGIGAMAGANLLVVPVELVKVDLAPAGSTTVPVQWEWTFEGADDVYTSRSLTANADGFTAADVFDTKLGLAAKGGAINTGFTIKITATQID